MNNYVITYVTNIDDFLAELESTAPYYIVRDEDDNITGWTIQTTPVVKTPKGTLAMSILTDDELAFISTNMSTIKSLGTYDELFNDEEAHTLYKSVYPYDVPIKYTDEDGTTVEYYRPKKIGEFAL